MARVEVPCAVAIRTARSVIEEVPEAGSSSIRAISQCNTRNPERSVHNMTKKFNLRIPIPLTDVELGGEKYPILRVQDWARFLLSMNLWHSLCGLDQPNDERCCSIWGCFWERYRAIHPRHPVFRGGINLSRTCALLLHGDEGRSLKKAPILCVSTHSILGYGIRTSKTGMKKDRLAMNLNYEQPTWTTRFLLSVLPHRVYADDDDGETLDTFQELMGALGDDLRVLSDEGILGHNNQRYYFVVLSVMGDWPWLVKCGCLERSFYNAAKRAHSGAAARGICHQCMADTEGYPWEDWFSNHPRWMDTMNSQTPFYRRPEILRVFHDETAEPYFFSYDLFHGWHIGAGKSFLASAVVTLAMSGLYSGSRETRIQELSDSYAAWCKANRKCPTLKKFTLANLGLTGNTFPTGTWSKGATTTCIMKWFVDECQKRYNEFGDDELLITTYRAALEMNSFLSGVYSYELWIPSREALQLAAHGFQFLREFGKAAKLAFDSSRLLFIQVPNYHRLHHLFLLLRQQASIANYAMSPLAMSTQSDEDFIGRPSRISRRVNPRTTVRRVLERSLEAAHAKYVRAGRIVP